MVYPYPKIDLENCLKLVLPSCKPPKRHYRLQLFVSDKWEKADLPAQPVFKMNNE